SLLLSPSLFRSCPPAYIVLYSSPTRRSSDLSTRAANSVAAVLPGPARTPASGAYPCATFTARRRLDSPQRATTGIAAVPSVCGRSEEHTSELQSRFDLVCRLLLEKKNMY